MKPMNKKGVFDNLGNIILALVSVGITLVVGFLIMGQADTQIDVADGTTCALDTGIGCSFANNGSQATIEAMEDIPGWLPIIVITLIGALLIGLVSVFRRR